MRATDPQQSADVFGVLDEAFDMAPLKSARARRLHGAYTRAARALLASAAELEMVDGCADAIDHLRREAEHLAAVGALRVSAAGRARR